MANAYTYTKGFDLEASRPITSKTIVAVIDALHAAFGEGHSFAPEAISEGGIEYVDWPGRRDGEYKAMRFQFDGKWPFLHDQQGTLNAWRTGNEFPIFYSPSGPVSKFKGNTMLKAFYGAPCWTSAELKCIAQAFEATGVRCTKMPPAKTLVDDRSSNLGKPLVAKK